MWMVTPSMVCPCCRSSVSRVRQPELAATFSSSASQCRRVSGGEVERTGHVLGPDHRHVDAIDEQDALAALRGRESEPTPAGRQYSMSTWVETPPRASVASCRISRRATALPGRLVVVLCGGEGGGVDERAVVLY